MSPGPNDNGEEPVIEVTAPEAPQEETQEVVNAEHLMSYVNEQKKEGTDFFMQKNYPKAIEQYMLCLGAIQQSEGLPMMIDDVRTVCSAKSAVLTNLANCYYRQEYWKRCVDSATSARNADGNNPKAPYWRAKGNEQIKKYLDAIEDVKLLEELKTQIIKKEERDEWIERLQKLQEKYDSEFDDRIESFENSTINEARERFDEVVKRNGLRNDELGNELADYIIREDTSAKGLAAIYQIDEDDAEIMLKWITIACKMKEQLGGADFSSI